MWTENTINVSLRMAKRRADELAIQWREPHYVCEYMATGRYDVATQHGYDMRLPDWPAAVYIATVIDEAR